MAFLRLGIGDIRSAVKICGNSSPVHVDISFLYVYKISGLIDIYIPLRIIFLPSFNHISSNATVTASLIALNIAVLVACVIRISSSLLTGS